METKVCSICKIEKPLSEFYRKCPNTTSQARRAECKACHKKACLPSRKNPMFKTFWSDRARFINTGAKRYPHLIDEKVSGKELRTKFGNRKNCYWCGRFIDATEYTFDHLIPMSRGGHNQINNIDLCCPTCNPFKNTQTPSEFLALIQHIASHHNLLAREG